jgi:hypothetical protein
VYTHKHISPSTVLSSNTPKPQRGTRCTYNLPLFGDLMTIRLKLQRDKIFLKKRLKVNSSLFPDIEMLPLRICMF